MIVEQLKASLHEQCSQVVEKRHLRVKKIIADIAESLLGESKSSAGDKHETGRAMLQIERENAGKQLFEIENLRSLIRKIDIKTTSDYARLGSLVYTNHGTFFISISIGTVAVGNNNYICVALHSPIGNFLAGKKKTDTFNFNNLEYSISKVC